MDDRIGYVDETLGFLFEHGFARKFAELGSPPNDLEFWYRNAVVYRKITSERPITQPQRQRLVTLIEAIRLDAMHPLEEPIAFDLTAYDFSEDVLLYKTRVIEEILKQERESRSSIDPLKHNS